MVNYHAPNSPSVSTDDFVAIQRLVHRYADAVVHRDAAQWGSCWAPDAQWDLGRGRKVNGSTAIVELWTTAMAGMEAVVQTVDNGDAWYTSLGGSHAAAGRWYITETFLRAAQGDLPAQPGILRAHYDDSYVRDGNGWRFRNRVLQVHYQGPPDLTAPFLNTAAKLSVAADEVAAADA
ncbi:MAG: nuclear transport factor 2 family protein [Ilumatobacteraceae bacterium]